MIEFAIVILILIAGFGALKNSVRKVFRPIDKLLDAANEGAEVIQLQTKIWSEAKKRELNKNRSAD